MNRIPWKGIATGAFLLAAIAPAPLAADDLPKAETILDKYIEATGGKAAYEKLHSSMTVGSMDFGASGIKGTVRAWHAAPDKSLMETELQGVGKLRDGYDGNVAWSYSPVQGPRVKEGEEKAEAARQARFNPELHWRELYSAAETAGIETVGGKRCYKLVLTPRTGAPVTRYYDRDSNLLVKAEMTAKTPMGEVPVELVVSDYRKEGEILSPHKVTQSALGQQFTITLQKVEYNIEIPKETFDPPPEIRALLDKR
jgi:hypothetical protein